MALNTEKEKKLNYTDHQDYAETEVEQNLRVISPSRMVAKRFFKSKLSIIGLIMILFVFVFSFLGPLIIDITWGYNETEVFKIERNTDMVTTAQFTGPDGKPYDYYDKSQTLVLFKAPLSSEHLLGTDTSGFDIFTRLMYGGRISLTIS
ncbi:MAG: hypothetical protein PHC56_04350, partial [Herbinix sp.]|nr:hypothetical protein [Herbinix sp.]